MAEGVQNRVFGGLQERRGLEISEHDFRIADRFRRRGAPGLERIQQVALEGNMEDSSTAIISDQVAAEGGFERWERAVGLRISAVETLTRNTVGKDLEECAYRDFVASIWASREFQFMNTMMF